MRRQLIGFALLLTVTMAASTFVQLAYGPLGPLLVQAFSLSRLQLGLLPATVFAVAALTGPRLGRAADVLDGMRGLRVLLLASCVPILGLALAPGFLSLLAVSALTGLLAAAGNPVTNRLLAEHAPVHRQGLMTGVKQSGVQVGGFLAALVLPTGAVLVGWRWAVAAMLALPLIGAALTGLGTLPPGNTPLARNNVMPVRSLDHRRATRLAWYSLLMGAGIAPAQVYLPLYAFERLGFSVPIAGLTVATTAAAGLLARLLWSHHAQRLADLGPSLLRMGAIAALAVLFVIGAELWHAALVWPGAVGLGAGGMAWNALVMLMVVRESARGETGRLSGFVVRGFFAGLLVGPPAAGALVDLTGSYMPAVRSHAGT